MALLILPYLLSNYYYFGGLSPVSGWLKSSFPHIFLGKPSGPNSFFGYNIVAGVVPVIIAVIFFPILKVRGSVRNLIMVLLTGSILHFFYTAFFTRFSHHVLLVLYSKHPAFDLYLCRSHKTVPCPRNFKNSRCLCHASAVLFFECIPEMGKYKCIP